MPAMRRMVAALSALAVVVQTGVGQSRQFKPGFNLFTKEQDVQLGKEAAAEIEKQVELVEDRELNAYISAIGARLAAQPQADKYPYTFKVVNDPSINAFALPGGPTYVHTGLIAAADNEAQLAGVLAHEIVHVALRHGTNQVSKANLIQLPALLASKAIGTGSLLEKLAQVGIGLGANSVLLKFSRTAETQADLLGVQIAAQAGYDPREMARFFQKLEADGGPRVLQFLSSHPNPGNRMKAIEDEIRYLPPREYSADTGRLARMKAIVAKLPPPKKRLSQQAAEAPSGKSAPLSIPESRPSGRMLSYQGQGFSLSYPDNWRAFPGKDARSVILAPPSALQQTGKGAAVGYGAVVSYYQPKRANAELWQATDELLTALKSANPGMRAGPETPREIKLAGRRAIRTMLHSDSIFPGQTEVDLVVTTAHPEGILYLVLVAPESEAAYANRAFDQMLQSLRLSF